MKITLAKALKLKNRLAAKLSKVTAQIQANNSIMKGKEREVDVLKMVEVRNEIVHALIFVKTQIYKANAGIQETIFTNAERKATIAYLNVLSTASGPQEREVRWGQDQKVVEFDAVISYTDVQEATTKLEAEIDSAQDEIDAYNHDAKIDVPQAIFELL